MSGELNPKATYSCVIVAQGTPVPLGTALGTQFPKAQVFNQALPYTGPANYSIYILETVPDQQPRAVSNIMPVPVK